MGFVKQCVTCGKEFTAVRSSTICCSPACSDERIRTRNRENAREKNQKEAKLANCVVCGKEFAVKGTALCCSKECSYERHRQTCREYVDKKRGGVWKNGYGDCVVCGKKFMKRTANQLTCSPACRIKMDKEKHKIRLYKKACAWCGKEFEGRQSVKYCSHDCAEKSKRKQIAARSSAVKLGLVEQPKKKEKKPTGSKALAMRQGVLITGKTDLQIANEARAAGMSVGRYRAMLQMNYEREMGIGMYASK